MASSARNTKTGELHQGYSSRARAGINEAKFKAEGRASGFQSKTNARKAAQRMESELVKRNPDVPRVLKRSQEACAEQDVCNKYLAKPNATLATARVQSVKLIAGVYKCVMRCENCMEFGELMGNVVTDLVAGTVVPIDRIQPYVVRGCACGAIAIACKTSKRRGH